jgi:hypothetical protein
MGLATTPSRSSTDALHPQGAVLPAKNQDASHHPLVPSQLRRHAENPKNIALCIARGTTL